MRIQIDLPQHVLDKIKNIAKKMGNNRKNHIEYVLTKYAKDIHEFSPARQTDLIALINEIKKRK